MDEQVPHRIEAPRAWRRWSLLIVVAVAAVAGASVALFARGSPPTQPMPFNHKVHVKEAKCPACHTTVAKAAIAGAPTLADCLDCHEGAQARTPAGRQEEAKLDAYVKAKTEIPWVRVWRLPSNVFFSHRTHVTLARVQCRTCHGPVETLEAPPTRPLKRLTMSDCLGCHEAWRWPEEAGTATGPVRVVAGRRLSTDCNACHR